MLRNRSTSTSLFPYCGSTSIARRRRWRYLRRRPGMVPAGTAPSTEDGAVMFAARCGTGTTGNMPMSSPDEGMDLEETTAGHGNPDRGTADDLPAAVLVVDDDPRNLLALEETLRGL